jgi:hypothetical protein
MLLGFFAMKKFRRELQYGRSGPAPRGLTCHQLIRRRMFSSTERRSWPPASLVSDAIRRHPLAQEGAARVEAPPHAARARRGPQTIRKTATIIRVRSRCQPTPTDSATKRPAFGETGNEL